MPVCDIKVGNEIYVFGFFLVSVYHKTRSQSDLFHD